MAPLKGVVLAALLAATGPAAAVAAAAPAAQSPVPFPPAAERWRPLIAEASRRFGVPEPWIAAVMQAESAGRTHLNGRPIVSRAGAMGLMQVMPDTYAEMRRRHGLGPDPYDPRDNILAGTAYLRLMHDRFGYPGLFGAYNAGPGRYAEHLATGRPLPAETRAYIAQLARTPADPALPPAILSGERLFFPVGRTPSTPAQGDAPPTSGGLFAIQRKTPAQP
ncbi:lytic transglycosylase domain-containing protein [Sphingomonas sp. 2378]|uniref:lytic transglycosylase domain-containing protein n=1 Tax=Sphingomonas sp. 2378 TaxID=1219748 RepID=UPI00311AD3BE